MGKTTNIDLVKILQDRNKDGRYDGLISDAKNNFFHDFKNPPHIPLPKAMLIKALEQFGELADLRAKVIFGEFDESPDEGDMLEMSQTLMGDGKDRMAEAPPHSLPADISIETAVAEKGFHLQDEWSKFLERSKMKEGQMHPVQIQEMRRAFVAGVAQFMRYMQTDLPLTTQKLRIAILTNLEAEIANFWKQEIVKQSAREN